MNIRQAFKMAFKSIFGNKIRSFLTMLGIIIGVASVIILVSVVQGQNIKTKEYYEARGTNKISAYAYQWNGRSVSDELYDYCLQLDDLVAGITPQGWYWAQNGIKYQATSTSNMEFTPEIYLGGDQFSICNNFTIAEGRDISYLDIKNYNQVIVLGARVKEYLFQYKNAIGETVTIDGYPFTVIGVYEAKDPDSSYSMDNMAVTPYTMTRILPNMSQINEYTIKAKSSSATQEAKARIELFLSGLIDMNSGYFYVYSENEWMEDEDAQNRTTSLVLGGIAGISLLVGGIGIMNIMLVTVTERTREIGIRKAIGGSRRSIIFQFLIEAAVVCAFGGLLGIIVGFLGTVVAGKLMLDFLLLPSAGMTVGAFAFSLILGMIFGLYPAIKASGLQPVEALRAE